MNVCKLLAIERDDILQRDLESFHSHGVSEQRTQLKYDYYCEKRMLKLKAIENILLKLQ